VHRVLTVITGPPCGGKSTYARQHARLDDIVVDFDLIAAALGSLASHGHSKHIAAVAGRAWFAAVCEAIARHHDGHRAWIIDTSPPDSRRRQYEAAGARIVLCTAPRAELHARAAADGRPLDWRNRIDQWLDARPGDPSPRPGTRW
jgi:predicted kinase